MDYVHITIHDYIWNQPIEINLLEIFRSFTITIAIFLINYIYCLKFSPHRLIMLKANFQFYDDVYKYFGTFSPKYMGLPYIVP